MHPLREAALNGEKDYRKALRAHFSKAGPLGPGYLLFPNAEKGLKGVL
jgi:hypothetical protein